MTQKYFKVLLFAAISTTALTSSALAQQATLEGYAKVVSALDSFKPEIRERAWTAWMKPATCTGNLPLRWGPQYWLRESVQRW